MSTGYQIKDQFVAISYSYKHTKALRRSPLDSLPLTGELLGHNDPKTTMIYTHVSSKKLSEINSLFDDFEL